VEQAVANTLIELTVIGIIAWLGGGGVFVFAIYKAIRFFANLSSGRISMRKLREDNEKGLGI
jgi:hypothetical protein